MMTRKKLLTFAIRMLKEYNLFNDESEIYRSYRMLNICRDVDIVNIICFMITPIKYKTFKSSFKRMIWKIFIITLNDKRDYISHANRILDKIYLEALFNIFMSFNSLYPSLAIKYSNLSKEEQDEILEIWNDIENNSIYPSL